MTTLEILHVLQSEIHSTVFATLDSQGLPQTCVIDLMLADENGLYFLTAKGKSFYERLMARPFVALSGMKGRRHPLHGGDLPAGGRPEHWDRSGWARSLNRTPIWPRSTPRRRAGRPWRCFRSTGARGSTSTCPSCRPSGRVSPSAGRRVHETGYRITRGECIGCQGCRSVCPAGCISGTIPRVIDAEPLPSLRQLPPGLPGGGRGKDLRERCYREGGHL